MNVDEIIELIVSNDSEQKDRIEQAARWRREIERLEAELSESQKKLKYWEDKISDWEKKRVELLAQLKAALTEDNPKVPKRIIEPNQTESDKPQDDDVYHLVRRSVQIDGVRWAKDADKILMVTVTDNETHEQQQLFTDNEPCIKACIYNLGKVVDVEYDKNSGELLGAAVLETGILA